MTQYELAEKLIVALASNPAHANDAPHTLAARAHQMALHLFGNAVDREEKAAENAPQFFDKNN